MKRTTAKWVRKAEEDHAIAVQIRRSKTPVHNGICFHCQQCAEKYLKGVLEERGMHVPKTHDLEQLLPLLTPHYPSLQSLRRGCKFLTQFAVPTRYPGVDATRRQAESARRWSDRIRSEVRGILGRPLRKPRRKKSP
jgi:HEPN domain-containing protein